MAACVDVVWSGLVRRLGLLVGTVLCLWCCCACRVRARRLPYLCPVPEVMQQCHACCWLPVQMRTSSARYVWSWCRPYECGCYTCGCVGAWLACLDDGDATLLVAAWQVVDCAATTSFCSCGMCMVWVRMVALLCMQPASRDPTGLCSPSCPLAHQCMPLPR